MVTRERKRGGFLSSLVSQHNLRWTSGQCETLSEKTKIDASKKFHGALAFYMWIHMYIYTCTQITTSDSLPETALTFLKESWTDCFLFSLPNTSSRWSILLVMVLLVIVSQINNNNYLLMNNNKSKNKEVLIKACSQNKSYINVKLPILPS